MDLFSTLQLLHEAVMSVLVTTIYGRWRGTITIVLSQIIKMLLVVKCGGKGIIAATIFKAGDRGFNRKDQPIPWSLDFILRNEAFYIRVFIL